MDSNKKPLVILAGPTAVGKTALSISLAKAINGEIISADSMQVYKKMNIGTAKITPEETQGVPHYLIDVFMPDEEFHVAKFKEYANQYIQEIYNKGKIPILVGGTGFYIQAVVKDVVFTEGKETASRKKWEKIAKEKGAHYVHDELKKVDPESAIAIHENNVRRVIRALEYFEQTGEKISVHNKTEQERKSPYHYAYFVLNQNRDVLYNRIETRIDEMIKMGLVEEVQNLLLAGYQRNLTSMQGLGYKEICAYLAGECSLEEAIYILKRDTRHFAKRQLTWFKREKSVEWVDKDCLPTQEQQLEYCIAKLREKKILL